MIRRSRVPLGVVRQYAALYLLLVAYSLAYELFYENLLTPIIHDPFTAYDPSRSDIYTAIAFLTPLAILPIGTKLRAAGQFIAGALTILLFIPIPIVFVPMTSVGEYWTIYRLLWIGYFILCALSSIDLNFGNIQFTDAGYKRLLIVVFAIVGLSMLYVAATNRVQLVSLGGAHAARLDTTISGVQGYLMPAYVCSFGGLLIAVGVAYRRYFLVLLAVAGFFVSYVTAEERTAAIMPLWVAFIFFAQKYFFRNSVTRYCLCVMAPFLVLAGVGALIGTANRDSLFYTAFMLATYRVYSIPAIAFNVYQNFFHFNPHTYWSHITLVSKFMDPPYTQSLALVMADSYHLGNYNASFLETDGLAAVGTAGLPWVCSTFGVVLVCMNSCTRRLSVKMLALLTAGASIVLMDVGLGPGLLTNGLLLLCVVLLFAPRRSPWTSGSATTV